MAIIVLQHWHTGAPGRLGMTLRDHGFKLDIRRPDLPAAASNPAVPTDLDNVHGVIILGGPQNVTDIAKYPWMQHEVDFIKRAHAANLPVIGICLGAQLIAHALGGEVGPRAAPLLAFDTASITIPGQTETMLAGIAWDSPQFFACEQEIKMLPPGATLLASSKTTPVQAFKAGLRTYGFIFHFECDRPMLEQLITDCKGSVAQADLDRHYPAYARFSDRLSVNLAAFGFSLAHKLSA